MFGLSNELLTNSIQPRVSRFLDRKWTPVVLYSPPGSGKTYFKRQVLFGGLPTFDTDEIWSYWFNRVKSIRKKDIDSGAMTEDMIYKMSYSLVGWSIYANICLGEIGLIVTNLHDLVLVQLARYGCLIIGYIPAYNTWYERIYNRMKNDEERKNDLPKYIKWYKDVLEWKKTNYDKINVWVSDLTELKYLLFTKIYSGFGRTETLRQYKVGMNTMKMTNDVILDSTIYFCIKNNMRPYFHEVSINLIKHICGRGIINTMTRMYRHKSIIIDKSIIVQPIAFNECDLTRRNEFLRCMLFVNNDCRYIFAPFEDYHLKNDSMIDCGLSYIIHKYKPKGVCYSLFLYRSSKEYNIKDDAESFVGYKEKIREDLEMIKSCIRDTKCVRVLYAMTLKQVSNKPIIMNFLPMDFYIPYENYGAVRILFVYDRKLRIMRKPGDRNVSITLFYDNVIRFNMMRMNDKKLDRYAFDYGVYSMTRKADRCNPLKVEDAILIGMPKMFVGMKKEGILRKIETWSKVKAVFIISWYDARLYIRGQKFGYVDGYYYEKIKDKIIQYPSFTCDEVWKFDIQIFPLHDFITMNRYNFVKDKWYINEKFSCCNPSDNFLYRHMVVGNIMNKKDMKYQTVFNSQTHAMLLVSRMLRITYGFSSKHVYRIRGTVISSLSDVKEVVSSDVTFISDDKAYSVSGHAINVLYASRFHPIDLRRWIETVLANIKMKKDYIINIKKLMKLNLLTEPDGALMKWHVPKEFEHIEKIANLMLERSSLPKLDGYVVKKLFKKVVDLKGYVGKSLDTFDISKE